MSKLLTAIKMGVARRRMAKQKVIDAKLCAEFTRTFEKWMPNAASAFTKHELESAVMSYLIGTRRLWCTVYMAQPQCDVWQKNFALFARYYREWVQGEPEAIGGFHEWCMLNRVKATLI